MRVEVWPERRRKRLHEGDRLLLPLRRLGMAVTRSVGTQVLHTYGLHSYGAALFIGQREAYHEFRTAAVRAIL